MSHSSKEAEVISLGTGLRMEELLARTLWGIVTDVLPPASRLRSDHSCRLKSKLPNLHKKSLIKFHQTPKSAVILICSFCDEDDNQGQEPALASCFAEASCELGLAFRKNQCGFEHFQ